MKYFIVDDDIEMIQAMTPSLEGKGHTVKSGVAGATAIPQIFSFKIDILLTDLVMAELDALDSAGNCPRGKSFKICGSFLSFRNSNLTSRSRHRKQVPSDIFKSRLISQRSRHASKVW